MHTTFKDIIQRALTMHTKCSDHPAVNYEVIGVISDALEKMDEAEMLAFDQWFFSDETRKGFTTEEQEVVAIIDTCIS